jgi:hypothetical protein
VGDIWFDPASQVLTNESTFVTKIRVNTGTQKLGAYTFKFSYDPTKLAIDESIGESGVTPGSQGFVIAANTTVPGLLTVVGFYANGKNADTDFDLIDIHWVVKKAADTIIKFTNDNALSLSDEKGTTIGTPQGYDTSIEFN